MAILENKKNILFIVEGDGAESTLIYHMNRVLNIADEYEVFAYNTVIYELYEELTSDPNLDLLLLLKEKASLEDRAKFSKKYTNIYLIFDFDPHHHKYDLDKLKSMLIKFSDSTNGGKLYINYPMVESFKHLKQMPDLGFLKRTVSKLEVTEYKTLVGTFPIYSNLSRYTYTTVRDMLIHHSTKYHFVGTKNKTIGDIKIYEDENQLFALNVLEIQNRQYNMDQLYVMNTSIFYALDISPKKLYKQLLNHQVTF
jgi:hypothetical protein